MKDKLAFNSVLFQILIIRDHTRLKLKICRMSVAQEDHVDFSYLTQSECTNDPAIKFYDSDNKPKRLRSLAE